MREVKFRAWEEDVEFMNYSVCVTTTESENYYEVAEGFGWIGVKPEHVMQYTGLKDENDKEVYEGDIVKTYDQNNIVKYQHGSFMLIGLHEDRYERNYSRLYHYLIDATIPNAEGSRFDGVTTTLKVIGNIYENPELLEVK